MTLAGIILLVLGLVIFVASFFIPDKGDREDKVDIEKRREQIRKLMESELDGMKLRVNEATNETVEVSMEKSERALEKIANEKIMAVSEYATTILEEIDRNHKEVVFLYDMLTDKHTDVKNTVRHAEATMREVEDAAKTASDTAMHATNVASMATEAVNQANEAMEMQLVATAQAAAQRDSFSAGQQVTTVQGEQQMPEMTSMEQNPVAMAPVPTESVFEMAARGFDGFEEQQDIMPVVRPVPEPEAEPERELTEFEKLERSTSFSNVNNNNQQILRMYAEGVSVVDIARTLSLGVGEVQLVIDLFK